MHQILLDHRWFEPCIPLRRHFTQPRTNREQQVRFGQSLFEIRRWADTEMTHIIWMIVIHQRLASQRDRYGQPLLLSKAFKGIYALLGPTTAACHDQWFFR